MVMPYRLFSYVSPLAESGRDNVLRADCLFCAAEVWAVESLASPCFPKNLF